MERVKTIMKKVIAVLVTFVIIMSQYVITGLIEVSYAIDLLATQNNNVQFRAYFKNGEEELTEIEKSIDAKDVKLKIDVAVKTQGYFNGQISFENAGFKITQTTENNYINKVENGVIYLNQINAEETASIEVGIEYLDEEKIEVSTLNRDTNVKLTGTYTHSGGNQTINGASPVKVVWKIPEGTKAELAGKVQTNSIYKVGEENKKVVQFLISSEVTNNCYPIKSTEIIATKPEGVTKVEVHKRTTKATNGEQEFEEANNVRQEGNNVIIKVENNEIDGKVSWLKGVNDVFVVTYEYPESADLSAEEILINSKITTYSQDKTTGNNIELNGEQVQLQLNETKDGIASIIKQEKENQIYKGKIYAGEEREITSYTLAYVDYVEGIKEIELIEEEAKYTKEVEENGETNQVDVDANVEIKTIKVNKQEIEKVLGETWNITIGEITITNTTEVDGNGNIEVTLPNGTKTATMKTSKPVNNGMFVIELKKVIKDTTNTREEKKELTLLKDICSVKYTKNNDDKFTFTYTYKIGLKDTESKASIQSEQQALIASDEAQQLNLTAVLESSGEHQDLYKNPTIKIKLPRQITSVTSTQLPQLINANGLTLTENNYTIEEENGQKVVNIKLTGEQTRYLGEAIQGTTIPIKLMININPNAEGSLEEIVMTYTNENATKYTDNGTQKINVEIIAKQNEEQNQEQDQNQSQGQNQNQNQQQNEDNTNSGSNQVQSSDIKVDIIARVGGDAINSGDTVKAGEIIEYIAQIKNTGNTDKTGISIEATVPENTKLMDINPNYPAYDSILEEYTDNRNYLIEKTDRKITKENVSIKAGETITINYMVKVDTNITEERNIENEIKVKSNNTVIETKKFQNKIQKGNLKVEYVPIYRKPGEKLTVSYNYVDKVYITNISNENQKNLEIKINKSNTITINKLRWYIDKDTHEEVDKEKSSFVINVLPANQTLEVIIDKTVSNYIDNKIIKEAEIMVEAKDSQGNVYKSNKLIEEIKGVNIKAVGNTENLTNKNNTGYVKIGDKIKYSIALENIGDYDADNMHINEEISKYLKIEKVLLNQKECEYTVENRMTEDKDNYNMISINSKLKKGEKANIEIICEVLSDLIKYETKDIEILNKGQISNEGVVLAKIPETKYILKLTNGSGGIDQNGNPNNNNNNNSNNNNNGSNNNSNNGNNKYSISGTAWLDTDGDGQRASQESVLSNIKVSILNLKNSSISEIGATNDEGKYYISNLDNGEYYIIFGFDTNKYKITKYHANNVNPLYNSDVENIKMNINNKYTTVASTDKITIKNNNVEGIDLGLIEKKSTNLILEKTISKITVTNPGGTKTIKYNNPALAKVEIKSKYLKNSTVVIEYNIKVTNAGETAGYVKNIVDYIPSSLTFNSKLNEKWYKKGKNIYTKSLANTKIKPGESKTVKLIMTKKMTESNTGLVNNKAEIVSSYNENGEESINNTENNMGSADVIISVSTGTAMSYIIITIAISLIMSTAVYLIIMKKLKESIEN